MDDFVAGAACGACALAGPGLVAAIVALVRTAKLRANVEALDASVRRIERTGGVAAAPEPAAGPAADVEPARSAPSAIEPAAAPPDPEAAAEPAPAPPDPEAAPPPPPAPLPPAPPPPALGAVIEKAAPIFAAAVGGLLLVGAALFAFREAIAHGWVGPAARFGLGVVSGLAALAAAEVLRARRYAAAAAGLGGAAAGILYGALWAGHARYGLVPQLPSFLAMAGLSGAVLLVATRRGSLFQALLAGAGAYLVPVLLSTGENKALAFFAYLLLVTAALQAAAWKRAWAPLTAMAGLATVVLYAAWIGAWRAPDQVAVGLLAAACLALVFASTSRHPSQAMGAASAAWALVLFLLGGLAFGTPTDVSRMDPVSGLPMRGDLGQAAALAAAYALAGAAALPYLLRAQAWTSAVAGGLGPLVAAVLAVAWAGVSGSVAPPWPAILVAAIGAPVLALGAGGGWGALAGLGLCGLALVVALGVGAAPGWVVGVAAAGIGAVAFAVGRGEGRRLLLPAGALLAGLALYPRLDALAAEHATAPVVVAGAILYLLYAMPQSFRPRRGDLGGALAGVAVAAVLTWPWVVAWESELGPEWRGVVAVLLGVGALLQAASLVRVGGTTLADRELAIVALAVLAFAALAVPLQLERQWLTIGWALEVAAAAWLSRKLRHPLPWIFAGALAIVVMVRLVANPEALAYGGAEGFIVLNWTLYTWGVPLVALLLAARWQAGPPWLTTALRTAAVLLGFALVNLEVAHAFAHDDQLSFRSEDLAKEMTRSVSWGAYGLVLVAHGVRSDRRGARLAGLAFIVLGAAKVFVVDLWTLSGFVRVGALGGMALSLLLAAIAFQSLGRAKK